MGEKLKGLTARRALREQARKRLDRADRRDDRLERSAVGTEETGRGDSTPDRGAIPESPSADTSGGAADPSSCTRTGCTERTAVHLDGRAEGPLAPGPYCFTTRRMRRTWRQADRRADRNGRAADLTVGTTRARKNWFSLFSAAVSDGALIRIRHTRYDEPAVLLSEAQFRRLERAARASRLAEGEAGG